MQSVIHEWLSLAILVIFMGISAFAATPLINETSTPIVKDYQDKTTISASGSIIMDGLKGQTGADIMMSLANTDVNTPYPRAIRINGSRVIKLDNTFQTNLVNELAYVYSHDGLKNMLDWKIIDIIFVYTTHVPGYGDILIDLAKDDNPANDNMYGYGVDSSSEGYWQYILQAP